MRKLVYKNILESVYLKKGKWNNVIKEILIIKTNSYLFIKESYALKKRACFNYAIYITAL